MLVIADDFTGALDTGIQFSCFGISVYVLFELKQADLPDAAVLIFDAETRHKSPEEAYAVIRETVSWAGKNQVSSIYKKTDSALRGNVGMEGRGTDLRAGVSGNEAVYAKRDSVDRQCAGGGKRLWTGSF